MRWPASRRSGLLGVEHWEFESHGIDSAQKIILRSALLIRDNLGRDLGRHAPQGLPLCGDQGGVIGRRSCRGLPKAAAADDGVSAAMFDAP